MQTEVTNSKIINTNSMIRKHINYNNNNNMSVNKALKRKPLKVFIQMEIAHFKAVNRLLLTNKEQ